MPVKFWLTIFRFWFFLSYLTTTVLMYLSYLQTYELHNFPGLLKLAYKSGRNVLRNYRCSILTALLFFQYNYVWFEEWIIKSWKKKNDVKSFHLDRETWIILNSWIKLSGSNCMDQIVWIKLSESNCLDQIV